MLLKQRSLVLMRTDRITLRLAEGEHGKDSLYVNVLWPSRSCSLSLFTYVGKRYVSSAIEKQGRHALHYGKANKAMKDKNGSQSRASGVGVISPFGAESGR